jgi:hypothetical protein
MGKQFGVLILITGLIYFSFTNNINQHPNEQNNQGALNQRGTSSNSEVSTAKATEVKKANEKTKSKPNNSKELINNSIESIWTDDIKSLSKMPHLPLLTYKDKLEFAIEEGNPDAAMHLYNAHTRCNDAPKSIAEVEGKSTKQSSTGETFLSRSSYEFYLEQFTYCEGFDSLRGTNDEYKLAYLIRLAARKGSINAKLNYSNAGFPYPLHSEEDFIKYAQQIVLHKEESIRHLIDAKALGATSALGLLGDIYYEGIITERNSIEAYAHYYSLEILINSPYDNPRLNELADNMTEEEINTAINLGNQYSKCCN